MNDKKCLNNLAGVVLSELCDGKMELEKRGYFSVGLLGNVEYLKASHLWVENRDYSDKPVGGAAVNTCMEDE